MNRHTDMMRQNLADIESYSHAMLGKLERGAGELPQWTNHILSTIRANMHDVVHFLRDRARRGRYYGGNKERERLGRLYGTPDIPYPQPGWAGAGGVATNDSRRLYAATAEAGNEATGDRSRQNLREIEGYAQEASQLLKEGAGIAPSWLEHKLSISAGHMDGIGHFISNEAIEGRKYGINYGDAVNMQGRMGYLQRAWRSLAPGMGPVQEYGSMGYGSMGSGSMDQSVQGAMLWKTKGSRKRRYSSTRLTDKTNTRYCPPEGLICTPTGCFPCTPVAITSKGSAGKKGAKTRRYSATRLKSKSRSQCPKYHKWCHDHCVHQNDFCPVT